MVSLGLHPAGSRCLWHRPRRQLRDHVTNTLEAAGQSTVLMSAPVKTSPKRQYKTGRSAALVLGRLKNKANWCYDV